MTSTAHPPRTPVRSALVIGGTGILAPAAAALAESGTAVAIVSRRGGRGTSRSSGAGGVGVGATTQIAVDASDPDSLSRALADRRWDLAIVYSPAVSPAALEIVRRAADRVVEVRVSTWVDPARGEAHVPADALQLGWTDDEAGGVRWHTPEEVSAAALEVVADGLPRLLGRVRPWEDRP